MLLVNEFKGAPIIDGGARSEHLAVMRYSIAGIAITNPRSVFFLKIFKTLINIDKHVIIWVSLFLEQNTLEVDPLDRHDVPRHDVKRVSCFYCL